MKSPLVARRNYLKPVRSIKHIVDIQSGLTAGTTETQDLVSAIDAPTAANVDTVEIGSVVNAIYLNVQVYATTEAALANVYLAVFKNPGGNLTSFTPNTLGANDNKKYVIHQEMRMLGGSTTEIPISLFTGVIKVPKNYRRMGTNDILQISVLAPGVNIDYCVQCIYKEIR